MIIESVIRIIINLIKTLCNIVEIQYLVSKGNFAEKVFNFRVAKMKFVNKHSFLLGFGLGMVGGFTLYWLLFVYNRGKIIRSVLCENIINFITYVSPYGRLTNPSEKVLYVLNVSTVLVWIGFGVCLIIFFLSSRKFIFTKLVLAVTQMLILWYLMYAMSWIIVKIPVFYKVLAFLAVLISSTISWFLIFIPIMNTVEKLDS